MKKLNYLFLILFVIDLIILLGYGQRRKKDWQHTLIIEFVFTGFISSPSPIFLGGYLFGQLLLHRSLIFMSPTVEKVLLILNLGFLIVYLAIAVLLTVHVFTDFLPLNIAGHLSYFIMSIFTKALFLFSALGLTLFVCLSSRKSRKESLSDSTL